MCFAGEAVCAPYTFVVTPWLVVQVLKSLTSSPTVRCLMIFDMGYSKERRYACYIKYRLATLRPYNSMPFLSRPCRAIYIPCHSRKYPERHAKVPSKSVHLTTSASPSIILIPKNLPTQPHLPRTPRVPRNAIRSPMLVDLKTCRPLIVIPREFLVIVHVIVSVLLGRGCYGAIETSKVHVRIYSAW